MSERRRCTAKDSGQPATYLGDGAYARFDGFSIWLTAENGIEATDEICLEPEVLGALIRWAKSLKVVGETR